MQALSLQTPGDLSIPEREEPRFRTDKVAKSVQRTPLLDLTDFKRDLSELTDRLGNAQDCL
tara:strand:- start:1088 stop:1270 length:183 start_codon:yes stop_codon:yes gene_type:complete